MQKFGSRSFHCILCPLYQGCRKFAPGDRFAPRWLPAPGWTVPPCLRLGWAAGCSLRESLEHRNIQVHYHLRAWRDLWWFRAPGPQGSPSAHISTPESPNILCVPGGENCKQLRHQCSCFPVLSWLPWGEWVRFFFPVFQFCFVPASARESLFPICLLHTSIFCVSSSVL